MKITGMSKMKYYGKEHVILENGALHVFKKNQYILVKSQFSKLSDKKKWRTKISKYYYYRFWINGASIEKTTKTSNKQDAIKISKKEYQRAIYRKEEGLQIHRQKFKKLWFEFLKDKDHNTKKESTFETVKVRGNILLKFFKDFYIDKIDKDKVQEWIGLRLIEKNQSGEQISKFTVRNDIGVLNQFMIWCFENEKIEKKVTISKKWVISSRLLKTQRIGFSWNEYLKLRTESMRQIKKETNRRIKFQKTYLHQLMVFAVNTGMRISEIYQMRWIDIKFFSGTEIDKWKQDDYYVHINIGEDTKTGARLVKGFSGAFFALVRLKSAKEEFTGNKFQIDSNTLVFEKRCRGGFNELLKKTNLKFKIQGTRKLKRDLTTFRHTFIIWGIIRKIDLFTLHTNCGTSIDMIQKHYAKYLTMLELDKNLKKWGSLKVLK